MEELVCNIYILVFLEKQGSKGFPLNVLYMKVFLKQLPAANEMFGFQGDTVVYGIFCLGFFVCLFEDFCLIEVLFVCMNIPVLELMLFQKQEKVKTQA